MRNYLDEWSVAPDTADIFPLPRAPGEYIDTIGINTPLAEHRRGFATDATSNWLADAFVRGSMVREASTPFVTCPWMTRAPGDKPKLWSDTPKGRAYAARRAASEAKIL